MSSGEDAGPAVSLADAGGGAGAPVALAAPVAAIAEAPEAAQMRVPSKAATAPAAIGERVAEAWWLTRACALEL
jgi:hypothetical protein